jgi:hypothetical protein
MRDEAMNLKENKDYDIIDIDENTLGIQFDGFKFCIDYVTVKEENGKGVLHYYYHVINSDAQLSEVQENKLGAIIEKLLREEYGNEQGDLN